MVDPESLSVCEAICPAIPCVRLLCMTEVKFGHRSLPVRQGLPASDSRQSESGRLHQPLELCATVVSVLSPRSSTCGIMDREIEK